MPRDPETVKLFQDLAAPFDPKGIKWKPQAVKGNRCMAIAYIDARVVCDRLDSVIGPENWSDQYQVLADGSTVCTLSVIVNGALIAKQDVGSLSEQPDAGNKLKAAFSDALKRAAVKFGIGRYLYRLPNVWVDYDPNKKMITQPPALPNWAMPKPTGAGQPKQTEKSQTPEHKNTQQAVAMALDDWRKRMVGVQGEDDMNEVLPLIKKIPTGEVKTAVWDYIQEACDERGIQWDEKASRFVNVPADNDPIPF